MDYETRATSRKELRLFAKLFRSICGFAANEPIDPVALLDKLPELEGFEDVRYISYVRKNGDTVKYSKTTNEFVVVDKKGNVKTYYSPKKGIKEFYNDRRRHK